MASRRKRGPVAFRPRLLAGLAFSFVGKLITRTYVLLFRCLGRKYTNRTDMEPTDTRKVLRKNLRATILLGNISAQGVRYADAAGW